MVQELRKLREVILLPMLHHQQSFRLKQRQSHLGYRVYPVHRVWRVSKNKIKLLLAGFHILENITSDESVCLPLCGNVQLLHALADEVGMVAVLFYAYHLPATSREQFKRYASCAREEVQRRAVLKVGVALQDIEKVFLRKIRRRARLEGVRHIEMPAFIYSGYNSHLSLFF